MSISNSHINCLATGFFSVVTGSTLLACNKETEAKLFLSALPPTYYALTTGESVFNRSVFRKKWIASMTSSLAGYFTSKILDKILENSLVGKVVKVASTSIVSYVTQKWFEGEDSSLNEVLFAGTLGSVTGAVQNIVNKLFVESASQTLNTVSENIIPAVITCISSSSITHLQSKWKYQVKNDALVTVVNSVCLFTLGLKFVNEGKIVEGSIILRGSIPAMIYAMTENESNYKEEIYCEKLKNGFLIGVASESVKHVIQLSSASITPGIANLVQTLLKPQVFSKLQTLGLKRLGEIANRVFTQSVVSMTDSFLSEPHLTLKKFVSVGFANGCGAFAETIIPSSVNLYNKIDAWWRDSTVDPRVKLSFLNIFRSMVNKVTTTAVENKIEGKKWNKNLTVSTIFFRSMIALMDCRKPMDEYDKKLDVQIYEIQQEEVKLDKLKRWPEIEKQKEIINKMIATDIEVTMTQHSEVIAFGSTKK